MISGNAGVHDKGSQSGKMIYLDNAATTLRKPEAVVWAVHNALTSLGNAGRGVHGAMLESAREIFQTRGKIAELFHADSPNEIVFTMNSTESLNIAIKGTLQAGDHVITTALEHNSVLRPLYEMEAQGVELTIVSADAKGNLCYEDIKQAIRLDTKAIVCTHGSNLTGNIPDIQRIGKLGKEQGILFIVDASQTAGVLPIDVHKMHIDILCFTGHKSLLGPQGTGGMYVRQGVKVKPLLSGGSGVQSFSKVHPEQMPTALEAGTLNSHGLAGLGAAVQYLQETGIDNIRKQELDLMWYFYHQVKSISGVTVYGDFETGERCPIVALNIRDYNSSQVSDALYQKYGIATRAGAHCAPLMHQALGTVEQGAVRFSFSHYNTMEEVEQAVKAIKELAEE